MLTVDVPGDSGPVENNNGNSTHENGIHDASLEEPEPQLPFVHTDEQIYIGDLISRVMQTIYAELSEMAETLPDKSDAARKRTIADWVVRTKKQVVKLYATVKWARDAEVVQKAMNVIGFILNQNEQFLDIGNRMHKIEALLATIRLRNHDLLTALDVLTSGTYKRLPTTFKKAFDIPTPLSDDDIRQTLSRVEDAMRLRLRMSEIVPVEMSHQFVAGGRAWFTAPKLFKVSVCLHLHEKTGGWFFNHVEFLFNVGGDQSGMEEFPRRPIGAFQHHISEEVTSFLSKYIPHIDPPPGAPPRPELPPNFIDAPLVRLFNFFQFMSLSYQLEVLWYQAERMRSLDWAETLHVSMSNFRKTLTATYWIRPPAPTPPGQQRPRFIFGGTLTIAIVEATSPIQAGGGPLRTPKQRILAELQRKAKIPPGKQPSDEVAGMRISVRWEPSPGALDVNLPHDHVVSSNKELTVDPDDLDFESLLRKAIRFHVYGIFKTYQYWLQNGPNVKSVFSSPGVVTLVNEPNMQALRVHLCASEEIMITIDARSGRLSLRDTGDLSASGSALRLKSFSERLNENPKILVEALVRLRSLAITDMAEQKAKYLGLQIYRQRNFPKGEVAAKLGQAARGFLYIQLASFPDHYLVLVITDEGFRYALITSSHIPGFMHQTPTLAMQDVGWLDVPKILAKHSNELGAAVETEALLAGNIMGASAREANEPEVMRAPGVGFNLETWVLRELYSYCCARVAYVNVEAQLKRRDIPFTCVNSNGGDPLPQEIASIQSSLAQSVPSLCVQSKHILSGAPAAEAAMPNIRVIPLNWWSAKSAQVVTCVKLKYVQQPMGKTAATTGAVIRPSKRIIYDPKEAVVSFVSENVNTCVDEFLEEWARVSKMVVIAREVAQMAKTKKWNGVHLISFDLQTVEFAYAEDYAVSITCTDQLSATGGKFDLRFSRSPPRDDDLSYNPHDDAEPFFRDILQHGQGKLALSIHRLVALLRDTLPIVVALDEIRCASGADRIAGVDTFAKAPGWYRLLYGDLRHALDFRLMTGKRVVILDASHSLYQESKSDASTSVTMLMPGQKPDLSVKPPSAVAVSFGPHIADAKELCLQPIPHIQDAVMDAVREVRASRGGAAGRIAPIDVGVVCDATAVRAFGRALHEQVLKRLEAATIAVVPAPPVADPSIAPLPA
ncbi:hypothetical protein HGRIS_002339 [Hohenbuehelia grisea]|uniref:Mediator of RNA polymerase II transcription subunit 14 n=1 Tax=Hohenbuehelia grisea TaxID=104357 RepID=A0ABR3JK69_9AGAR